MTKILSWAEKTDSTHKLKRAFPVVVIVEGRPGTTTTIALEVTGEGYTLTPASHEIVFPEEAPSSTVEVTEEFKVNIKGPKSEGQVVLAMTARTNTHKRTMFVEMKP